VGVDHYILSATVSLDTYLIVHACNLSTDGIEVVHLQLARVTLAFLRMFRRYAKIHMTQVPPIRKPLTEIDPTETRLSIPVAVHYVLVIAERPQRLVNLQRVALNGKGVLLHQVVETTRTIVIGHPMFINTLIVHGVRRNSTISFQINGALVMNPTVDISLFRAPSARVFLQFPFDPRLPTFGPAHLWNKNRVCTRETNEIFKVMAQKTMISIPKQAILIEIE
jgi:hypothetical protein